MVHSASQELRSIQYQNDRRRSTADPTNQPCASVISELTAISNTSLKPTRPAHLSLMPPTPTSHHICRHGQCWWVSIIPRYTKSIGKTLSNFNWHLGRIKITNHHRTLWNHLLNAITVTNTYELLLNMGPWTAPPTSCPNRMHQQALYVKHSDGLWYQHQRSRIQRRTRASTSTPNTRASTSTCVMTGCTQQQLPTGATIVDVRKEGGRLYVKQNSTTESRETTYAEESLQQMY